jgi:hypothetical protein
MRLCIALLFGLISVVGDDSPRAARSVHLRYPDATGDVVYNEVTVERSTPGSYFMACGFSGGYFGIQDLPDGKKIAIFSVWDSTKEDEPDAIPKDQRVVVLKQNEHAKVQRFGGEGTGAQCLLDFDWKIGQTVCFVVKTKSAGKDTEFSAWIKPIDAKQWTHMATYRSHNGGHGLRGLYSFIEDFRRDTKSATKVRRATFGNGWIHASDGKWNQLTRAQFTASGATWEAKETIDAGIDADHFYLQTGGDTKLSMELKGAIERQPNKRPPPDVPAD